MTNDHQLLREYARNGSETAFRELVNRHIGLVYSAALRVGRGERQLAEDVTQSVFAALAREARTLPQDVVLAGWLHRAACFVAAKSIRTEHRRRARERIAMDLKSLETGPDPKWQQIEPHLDEAINELNPPERDAVVLRYFNRQDFRAVGAALGVSEDTAQKRVSRALEKLRGLLERRGIALGAGTLGSTLAAEAVAAAPAGLATTVATASLSAAAAGTTAGFTTLKVLAMTKMQITVAGAVVLVGIGVPLLLQHRALTHAREQHAVLREQAGETSRLQALVDGTYPRSADPPVTSADGALTGAQRSELLRLRGEVTRLRQDMALLEKTVGGATPSHGNPPALDKLDLRYIKTSREAIQLRGEEFSKESWSFAGRATMKDAVQSLLWAMREGDLKSLLEGYSAGGQKSLLEHLWKDKAEAQISRELRELAGAIEGVTIDRMHVENKQINGDTTTNPDTYGNRVQVWVRFPAEPSDRTGTFWLQRIGDEWKCFSSGTIVGLTPASGDPASGSSPNATPIPGGRGIPNNMSRQ